MSVLGGKHVSFMLLYSGGNESRCSRCGPGAVQDVWLRSELSTHIYSGKDIYLCRKEKKNNLCAAHALLPVALNVSEHVLKSTLSEEAATPVW